MSVDEIKSNIDFLVEESAKDCNTGNLVSDLWHVNLLETSLDFWLDAYRRAKPVRKVVKDAAMDERIRHAKAYPLEKLIRHQLFMAKCPFHNDSSPSLNIKNNFYYCHGCGESGDTISFVMKTAGMTFLEAVSHLNGLI